MAKRPAVKNYLGMREVILPQTLRLWVWLFSALMISSCAYRFSNLHVRRPEGIQKVAVEAVFDTSGEVLPHEALWEHLQRAVARNGHLRLTAVKEADAIVRAHLREASTKVTSSNSPVEVKDPDITELAPGTEPPLAKDIDNITVARKHSTEEALGFVVDVEVWDLRSRKRIFARRYAGSAGFKAITGEAGRIPELQYLRYEEARSTGFEQQAEGLADEMVRDLLNAL